MGLLNKLSELEINNLFNKLRDNHESKKREIESLTYELEDIVKTIEKKEDELKNIEEEYTELIKFIYNKKDV